MKALLLLGFLALAYSAAEKEILLRNLKVDCPGFREVQEILSRNAMVGSRRVGGFKRPVQAVAKAAEW